MDTNRDDVSALNRAIGGRVAWYMKYAGDTRRTQTQLAELLGIEQSAVSKKLTGRRPFFPHELYAVAEWLDRSLGDFLPLSNELDAPPRGVHTAADNMRGTGRDTDELVAAA